MSQRDVGWKKWTRVLTWNFLLAIITILLYCLGFLLLHPLLGVRARLVSFPLVWFWAFRSGSWAGVAASLFVDLVLQDALYLWIELPDNDSSVPITTAFLILNICIGVILGRMATLGRSLASELDKRIKAEALLRESEECYRLLFEFNPHPMWVADRETLRFLAINAAALEHYGYRLEELDRMSPASFLPPGEVTQPNLAGPLRHQKKDGTIIDVETVIHPFTFQVREAWLVLATDVTERKQAQAALEHRAYHDVLTGLLNRASFRSSLDVAIGQSRQSLASFAVFLMDLDRFKVINDTLGHAFGDQVLKEIGPRLRKVLRPGDLLARLGGDEFGILLPDSDGPEALLIADRVLKTFLEPVILDGLPFDLGCSLGIAIHPDHGDDVDEFMHRADVAMYASKRLQDGAVLYSPKLDEPTSRSGMVEAAVRRTRSQVNRVLEVANQELDG